MSFRKKITLMVFLLFCRMTPLYSAPSSQEVSMVTLTQCYAWAQTHSEDLMMRREEIKKSQARAQAAFGGALPNIKWQLTDTWQDPQGVEALEKKGFVGFVEKEQIESKFSLKQPLFSGFREFSAWSGFKKESVRDQFLFKRASFDLFEQTANAFYSVLKLEADRDNTAVALRMAEDRLKELKGFLKLGKARESEVFTAQAYAAGLKARIDQIQGAVNSAREELSYLTGQSLIEQPLKDEISNPTLMLLDEALSQAKQRTDLKAYKEEDEALRLRIRYERGFYWPTADVMGSYYTQRATFMSDIDWDVALYVEMPLFQGGKVSARVKEAAAAYRQSHWKIQQMERQIIHMVRKNHGDLSAAIQETRSFEEATQAAQKSYDSLRQEYKLGLVTNLDVLQALDFLQTQKSALDAARFKMKMFFIQLNVATESPLATSGVEPPVVSGVEP